jgi:hypothetical protein
MSSRKIRDFSSFYYIRTARSVATYIIFYRTGLAAQILEEKEKARSKLGAENEDIGKVIDNIKKRKKEQRQKSGSSKKRYV